MEHQAAVGNAGQHQLDIDATLCGAGQRGYRLRVRHEVSRRQVNRFLRLLHRQNIGFVDFEVAARFAGDDPDQLVADGGQRREETGIGQVVCILPGPGPDEHPLEGRHGRTLDHHVGIAPAHFRCVGGALPATGAKQRTLGIGIADVDAAGERDLAIDDQDLAVVAIVQPPTVAAHLGRIDRIEGDQLDAGATHAFKKCLRHAQRAHAVIQDADSDALLLLLDQHVGKLQAHLILVEDIGFQVDVVGRCSDRLQHLLHRLRSVEQQRDLVAGN